MFGWLLFLLFIVLPLVELWLLVQIGQVIGFWRTVAIVVGTGLLGAFLARQQGVRAWRDVTAAWSEGRVPGVELMAGALFLVGAAFLLTPGVLTDATGLLLMVPFVRRGAARGVLRLFRGRAVVHVRFGGGPAHTRRGGERASHGNAGAAAPGAAGDDDDAPRVIRSRRVEDDT